jgi:hypothetical protein
MVLKRTQNKLQHARRRYKTAEAALRALQRARDDEPAHCITAEFVAKVALSAPSSSSRAFADAWADLIGVGAVGCSRRTIGRVRDAFSEVVKELYLDQVERAARRSRAAETLETARALGAGSRLADFVVLLHLHDEASLRLRSSSDVGAAPSRGRSSKVMQHSVWVQVGGQGPRRFVPTELCALANKTANVIARSLYEVLKTAATRVQAGFGRGTRPWLIHVLVGDGVASNEAAAKVLLPWAKRDLSALRCLIVSVKCASHQVNLSIGIAVAGIPAICAAGNSSVVAERSDALGYRQQHADALAARIASSAGLTYGWQSTS